MDKNKVMESASKLISKGQFEKAVKEFQRVLEVDPDDVRVLQKLAELRRAAQYLQRNGRTDDYLRVAEGISHLDQSDVTLARELAESYLSRGDSKRALAKLQICFKANPRDLGTLQMLARAFQELGQLSKTVSVLKELARVHLDSARNEEARRTYQQALELAPDDQEVKAGLKSIDEADARQGSQAQQPAAPRPPMTAPIRPAPAAIVPPVSARPPTGPIHGPTRRGRSSRSSIPPMPRSPWVRRRPRSRKRSKRRWSTRRWRSSPSPLRGTSTSTTTTRSSKRPSRSARSSTRSRKSRRP